ncbi:MAG: hypothetical protein OXC68_02990, partial [Aestuariivita sp.]|nr:hypothetical protein [Aestuariivita sp.]
RSCLKLQGSLAEKVTRSLKRDRTFPFLQDGDCAARVRVIVVPPSVVPAPSLRDGPLPHPGQSNDR